MIRHVKPLFACLLVCITIRAASQTYSTYYDFNFREHDPCRAGLVWSIAQAEEGYTRSEDANADSIFFLTYKSRYNMKLRMFADLRKHIVLPKMDIKSLEIGLIAKAMNTQDFHFRILGLNINNELAFDDKIPIKPSAEWVEYKIKKMAPNAHALYLYVQYVGDTSSNQSLFFKQLVIKVNGKDIGNLPVRQYSDPVRLIDKQVIMLDTEDSLQIARCLGDVRDKKIIGLGEMTHGSKSIAHIRYQFVKSLILNRKCRVVLIEYPVEYILQANLFVRGLGSEQDNSLYEFLKTSVDGRSFGEFLRWLKKYNETTTEKVHVFGIDNMGDGTIGLGDFYLALLGREKAKPYLKALLSPDYKDIINRIDDSSGGVKKLLDERLYRYYESVLNEKPSEDQAEWRKGRDYNMFRRTLFLDSLFNDKDEKTVILSHSGHLKKTQRTVPKEHYPVLGTFLHRHLGTGYFNIEFTFGSGTFIQDSCLMGLQLMVDTLKALPENSFEYAATKTGIPYLYYPTASLGNQWGTSARISRAERGKNPFHYAAFRKQTDGYVFLRNSEAFDDIPKLISMNSMKFFSGRSRFHREILGVKNKFGIVEY